MFWTIVLPFQITAWIFAGAMVVVIATSPQGLKKLVARCFIASLIALVAFVPSCMVVATIVDLQRFGEFHYADPSEVHDVYVKPDLPTGARDITVHKYASEHRAKYNVSHVDLLKHLDMRWQNSGEYSAHARSEMPDGMKVDANSVNQEFRDLSWPPLQDPIEFHSPAGHDGSGTTYYFEESTQTVYHRAGYW